jgi:hypothetical protein
LQFGQTSDPTPLEKIEAVMMTIPLLRSYKYSASIFNVFNPFYVALTSIGIIVLLIDEG